MLFRVVLSLLSFYLFASKVNAQVNGNDNQCTACDWRDSFCDWRTSQSTVSGTVTWDRVENFYPKPNSVGSNPSKMDVNDRIITSSARAKASYFSGQYVDPAASTAPPNSDGSAAQDTSNNGDINLASCTMADNELPPTNYRSKSSYLQIFVGKGFSCDGEIVAWRYVTAPSPTTAIRQIYASVWEPLPLDPNILQLVGWNLLPAGEINGWQHVPINKADRIRVKKGQYVGLHYSTVTLNNELAVVPHAEYVDYRDPWANWTMQAYTFNTSHAEIEAKTAVRINLSTRSRRLPALRAIVRAIRPQNEFQFYGDYYITAEALPALPVVGRARITSPEIRPVAGSNTLGQCLFFRYFLKRGSQNQLSTLTVWLQRGFGQPENIFTRNTETLNNLTANRISASSPWNYGNVVIPRRNDNYKITFEASPASGGVVSIASVEITPEPCTYSRETDILIPVASMSNGLPMNGMTWSDGQIPYVIDSDFSFAETLLIEESMDAFRSKTCISFKRFELGTGVYWTNYIRFRRPVAYCQGYSQPICSTFVGRQVSEIMSPFGEQPVFLDKRCFYPQGTILHILAHVVGLWHETNRPSRDRFLTIDWNNVAWQHKEDFDTYSMSSQSYSNINEFDFDSVTHLPHDAYADDPSLPTITKMEISPVKGYVGQRYKLSEGDINKIRVLYSTFKSCQGNNTVANKVTVTAAPAIVATMAIYVKTGVVTEETDPAITDTELPSTKPPVSAKPMTTTRTTTKPRTTTTTRPKTTVTTTTPREETEELTETPTEMQIVTTTTKATTRSTTRRTTTTRPTTRTTTTTTTTASTTTTSEADPTIDDTQTPPEDTTTTSPPPTTSTTSRTTTTRPRTTTTKPTTTRTTTSTNRVSTNTE